MNKKNKKEIILPTLEEVRKIIAYLRNDYTAKIVATNLHIETYRTIYKFSLIDKEIHKTVEPRVVSRILNSKSKYHNIDSDPDLELKNKLGFGSKEAKELNKLWLVEPWSGFHEVNEDLVDTPLRVWCYDINSAYAFAMTKPMPDTRHPYYESVIKENQVGFNKDLSQVITKPGIKCAFVFDLIESPFIAYVNHYYNIKKNNSGQAKKEAKEYLCIASGLIANHNPFLRTMIIWYSNTYIKQFWNNDPNAVYCNVDSIYTTKPRTDLPIGNELGQFKLEHENVRFIYAGVMQYQIEDEVHKCGMSGLLDLYDEEPDWHYDVIFDKDKIISIERKKELD